MAAIQEIQVGPGMDFFREVIREKLWQWIEAHRDDKVTTLKVWFVRKTVYIRDLYGVFELLLGPKPT